MPDEQPPLEVTCREVKSRLDSGEAFLFLDCRELDEAAVAKIAGTTLIPMSQLQQRAGELEPHKDGEIIVHCHHGGRSLRVAMWLAGKATAAPPACRAASTNGRRTWIRTSRRIDRTENVIAQNRDP